MEVCSAQPLRLSVIGALQQTVLVKLPDVFEGLDRMLGTKLGFR